MKWQNEWRTTNVFYVACSMSFTNTLNRNFTNEMWMIENWKFRMTCRMYEHTFGAAKFHLFWSVVENEWQSLNLFQLPIPENIFFLLFHFSTAQSIIKCSKRTDKQIAYQPFNPYETHKHILEYNFIGAVCMLWHRRIGI